MNDEFLEHHGILGQKWGIRRYQNEDGTLTEAGMKRYAKERYAKDKAISTGDAKWIKKHSSELTDDELNRAINRINLNKRLDSSTESNSNSKSEHKSHADKTKEKKILSGDKEWVEKHFDELTDDEIRIATNKINLKASLDSAGTANAMKTIQQATNNLSTVTNGVNKVIDAWNTGAKIYNSLSENPVPTIDGKYFDKVKEAQKKADEEKEKNRKKSVEKLIKEGNIEDILNKAGDFKVDELSAANKRFSEMDKLNKRANGETSDNKSNKNQSQNVDIDYDTLADILAEKLKDKM